MKFVEHNEIRFAIVYAWNGNWKRKSQILNIVDRLISIDLRRFLYFLWVFCIFAVNFVYFLGSFCFTHESRRILITFTDRWMKKKNSFSSNFWKKYFSSCCFNFDKVFSSLIVIFLSFHFSVIFIPCVTISCSISSNQNYVFMAQYFPTKLFLFLFIILLPRTDLYCHDFFEKSPWIRAMFRELGDCNKESSQRFVCNLKLVKNWKKRLKFILVKGIEKVHSLYVQY